MPAESRPKGQAQPSQLEWHCRSLTHAAAVVCAAWPRALEDAAAVGFPSAVMQPSTRGAAENTSVEAAALRPSVAVAWLAELHDVVTAVATGVWRARAWSITWQPQPVHALLAAAVERVAGEWTLADLIDADPASPNYRRDVFGLYRLADRALAFWPPPAAHGQTVAGVTVGDDETPEDCGLCHGPVITGRDNDGRLLARRIDGVIFHATAGYGHGACWWTVWRQRRSRSA